MPRFRFVAFDAKGRETEGIIDAESNARAIAIIKGKGYFPTSVAEVGGGGVIKAEVQKTSAGMQRELKLPPFLADFFAGRVKPKQLMVVTRQLATLLDAGVPLLRALQILLRQEAHPTLRKALKGIQEAVEGGSTFAEALAQQPKIFTEFYVNMVRAGEAGGMLEDVLLRMAEFMEKAERLRNKVKSAMVYPIVVLIVATAILTFLITKIIPQFAKVFQDLLSGTAGSKKLPGLTLFVMDLSHNAVTKGPFIVMGIIGLVLLLRLVRRTKKGRLVLDSIKLRMPLFGKLIRLTAVAHFARTLGTLLQSGVPILQALNIVGDTVGNAVVTRAVNKIHDSVKEGETMAAPMEESKAFPLMAISMVEVGEETGALPEMLTKVAETYEDEVDSTVEALTSILEPILIVFLAVIVGTIVIAMFLPIIKLVSTIGA